MLKVFEKGKKLWLFKISRSRRAAGPAPGGRGGPSGSGTGGGNRLGIDATGDQLVRRQPDQVAGSPPADFHRPGGAPERDRLPARSGGANRTGAPHRPHGCGAEGDRAAAGHGKQTRADGGIRGDRGGAGRRLLVGALGTPG